MTSCTLALFVLFSIATSLFPTPALSAPAWNLRGTTTSTSSNTYPSARHDAATWVANDTFWMFTGVGKEASPAEGYMTSIYNYNLTTNKWTLSGGSTALNNAGIYPSAVGGKGFPGGRIGAATWTDSAGNLWLFGGSGIGNDSKAIGLLNDLWQYKPASNEWFFFGGNQAAGIVSTDSTRPTPRSGSSCWSDSNGRLWIFGGNGMFPSIVSTGMLTDMWYYTPSTNAWTSYSSDVTPIGRSNAAVWTDKDGSAWIYGGNDAGFNTLSDLWQFKASDMTWYMKSGSINKNQAATYPKAVGGQGQPGGLYSASAFSYKGDLYLFGGYGYDASENEDSVRDMWRFNTTLLTWTFLYGTPGTHAGSFIAPGSRYSSACFVSASVGDFLIFGGTGYDTNGTTISGTIGDTWRVSVCSFDGTCTSTDTVDAAQSTGSLTTGTSSGGASLTSGSTKSGATGGATGIATASTGGATSGSTGSTTANTTAGTSTTGGAATTTGGTVETTAATVTVTMGMVGDPTQLNTSDVGDTISASLGVPAEFINITIVYDNGTTTGGKRALNIPFHLVITIFFPNSSAIAAVTGGAPTANMTAQLTTLQNAVTSATNSTAVRGAIASSGITITSVSASTQSQVVVTSSSTASTGPNWPYTTGPVNAASALSPSTLITLLVVFACSWALL